MRQPAHRAPEVAGFDYSIICFELIVQVANRNALTGGMRQFQTIDGLKKKRFKEKKIPRTPFSSKRYSKVVGLDSN